MKSSDIKQKEFIKKENCIKVNLKKKLKINIWRNIRNSKHKKLHAINKLELTQPQLNECSYLVDTMKEALAFIGLKTQYKSITKTKTGYTIRRQCNVNECNTIFCLQANIKKSNGEIHLNKRCKHFTRD